VTPAIVVVVGAAGALVSALMRIEPFARAQAGFIEA
jgi:hypothetical protein